MNIMVLGVNAHIVVKLSHQAVERAELRDIAIIDADKEHIGQEKSVKTRSVLLRNGRYQQIKDS